MPGGRVGAIAEEEGADLGGVAFHRVVEGRGAFRVSRAHRGAVLGHQHADHLDIPGKRGVHQRGDAFVVPLVHCGADLQEHPRHFHLWVASAHRTQQWGLAMCGSGSGTTTRARPR